jgi:predicted ester cyclase
VAADLLHDQLPEGWPSGRAGFKELVVTWRAAFPDMHEDVLQMVADGDWVVSRFRLRGTHRGTFYGLDPTGRRVEIEGVDFLRISGGQIAEWIYFEDALGLFRQLGVMPSDLAEVAGPSAGSVLRSRPGTSPSPAA